MKSRDISISGYRPRESNPGFRGNLWYNYQLRCGGCIKIWYSLRSVAGIVPQITTESWVRIPGPISGDRNISRFHHNTLQHTATHCNTLQAQHISRWNLQGVGDSWNRMSSGWIFRPCKIVGELCKEWVTLETGWVLVEFVDLMKWLWVNLFHFCWRWVKIFCVWWVNLTFVNTCFFKFGISTYFLFPSHSLTDFKKRVPKDVGWFIRDLGSVVKSAALKKSCYPQVPGSIPAENTSTQIHMDLSK